MTHAALQLLFCGIAPWVVPLRQWAKLDAAWWLFTIGTAAAILVSGLDFIARGAGGAGAFTSTGGDLDPFEVAAAVYTGVWGLAMLVGSPKGWKLRPPLGALSLSWLFWLVVLVIKWSFEYFALVRAMVLPTLALWEADYTCWEPGHTGKVGCSWDVGQGRFANGDYRAVRDWGFRFVLIALRWSTPVLIILADTVVVYMAVLSVASVLLAKWQRLGEPLAPPPPPPPTPGSKLHPQTPSPKLRPANPRPATPPPLLTRRASLVDLPDLDLCGDTAALRGVHRGAHAAGAPHHRRGANRRRGEEWRP